MAQIVHAARMGDEILHPSLLAEVVSAVAEAVIYAAATAAAAAAISLAVLGTVATAGTGGIVIGIVAGAAIGALQGAKPRRIRWARQNRRADPRIRQRHTSTRSWNGTYHPFVV